MKKALSQFNVVVLIFVCKTTIGAIYYEKEILKSKLSYEELLVNVLKTPSIS
jgi:hypothetical protein